MSIWFLDVRDPKGTLSVGGHFVDVSLVSPRGIANVMPAGEVPRKWFPKVGTVGCGCIVSDVPILDAPLAKDPHMRVLLGGARIF